MLWVVTRDERLGAIFTVFIFIFGTVSTFFNAYINQYHALPPNYIGLVYFCAVRSHRATRVYLFLCCFCCFVFHRKLEEYNLFKEFTHFYTQPQTRMATFFLGFGSAFVAKKLKDAKYTFSNVSV